jgi:aminoglycoside 2'-N-acetyltransferase I
MTAASRGSRVAAERITVSGMPVDAAGESRLELAHTACLGARTLGAARALLDETFGAEMTDHAWDHALGGLHALVWEGRELIGHASVVQRRLLHRGRSLRTGYIEGVAVRADRRGRGHGATMMDALEGVIRRAYEVGALGATELGAGLYAARGWRAWQGETWALSPSGPVRTAEEDDCVYVLQVAVALDLGGQLTCDWREGDLW